MCLKPISERVCMLYMRENIFVIYDVSKICWSQLLTQRWWRRRRSREVSKVIAEAKARLINKSGLKEYNQDKQSWKLRQYHHWFQYNVISKSCAVWSFHNYLILENWCVWVLSCRKNATFERNLIFWDDQICEGLVYFLLQFSSRQSLIIQILFSTLEKRHKSQYTSQFLYKRMW